MQIFNSSIMSYHELLQSFVSLLIIANPIGAVPIFLSLTAELELEQKRKIAIKAAFAVMIILIITAITGESLLRLFGVHIASFRAAGGLVILLIGLSMVRGGHGSPDENKENLNKNAYSRLAIVPLALPLMAGPGAISTVIIFGNIHPSIIDNLYVAGIIVVVSFILGLVLYFSTWVGRLLGEFGIMVITRIMGILLAAIAFEMLIGGIGQMLPGLLK